MHLIKIQTIWKHNQGTNVSTTLHSQFPFLEAINVLNLLYIIPEINHVCICIHMATLHVFKVQKGTYYIESWPCFLNLVFLRDHSFSIHRKPLCVLCYMYYILHILCIIIYLVIFLIDIYKQFYDKNPSVYIAFCKNVNICKRIIPRS